MSDIFHEVEEEVRRERLERIWKDYGDYIVAAACLLIIAAAGYQLWRVYDQRENAKASDAYAQAEQLYDAGQTDLAAQSFAHIAQTAPHGYAALARLQEADAMMASGKRDEAVALYGKIVSEGSGLLSDIARLHEGWAIADTASRAALESLLAPVTDPASAWRFSAREILAYADYRSGAIAQATREYAALAADASAPSQLHQRALAMATFLKAGGDRDYGTVPPLPEDSPTAAAAPAQTTPQAPEKK